MIARGATMCWLGSLCAWLLVAACAEVERPAVDAREALVTTVQGGVYAACRVYVASAEAHFRAGRATRDRSDGGLTFAARGSGAALNGRVSLVESARGYFEPGERCPLPPNCVRTARQPASGLHLRCSLDVAEQGERAYEIHVPLSYSNATDVPVLMELHAGGGFAAPPATELTSGFREVADTSEQPFLVVWPIGSSEADGPPGAEWQTCNYDDSSPERPCPAPGYPNDRAFLIEVLNKLARDLKVDRKRIYATGLSSGAAMVHTLACKYSEYFAAVAPMATGITVRGQPRARDNFDLTVKCEPTRNIPVFYAHSPHDQTSPFPEGAQAVSFWRATQRCAAELETTYASDIDSFDATDALYPLAQDQTICRTSRCGTPGDVSESAVAFCEVDGSSNLLNEHGHVIWLGDDFYFPVVQPFAPRLAQWAWDWLRVHTLATEPPWPPPT